MEKAGAAGRGGGRGDVIERSLTPIAVKQERRSLVPVGAELPEISCAALFELMRR